MPYRAQYADRDRIGEFLDHPAALHTDAHWREFGFDTIDAYAEWAPRLCGIACLRMVLDAHGLAPTVTMAALTQQAVAAGAYAFADPAAGRPGAGWVYAPLVAFAGTLGLSGAVRAPYSLAELADDLAAGRAPIVSVHPGVMREDASRVPDGERGGHLVLVTGMATDAHGEIRTAIVHNPNARTRRTQEAYAAPIERFTEAFAGRGLVLWRSAMADAPLAD